MTDTLGIARKTAYFGVDAHCRDILATLCQPVASRHMRDVMDSFYAHVTSYSDVVNIFASPDEQSRVRQAQARHVTEQVLAGHFDKTYHERARTIGQRHIDRGVGQSWYVGAYVQLLTSLQHHILADFRYRPKRQIEAVTALTRGLLLDMDTVLEVYHEGLRERQAAADAKRQTLIQGFDAEARKRLQAVDQAVAQLDEAASSMTQRADSTQRVSDDVASRASEAGRDVESVAAAGRQLTDAIHDISGRVADTVERARQARSDTASATERVSGLKEAAAAIGDAVTEIQTIAEQTNLLALNATIEAARAGEAGKGFAVVANEVKTLANQTREATETVTERITRVQNETQEAVAAIERIASHVASIDDAAAGIASAVEEQSASADAIAKHIQQAADATTATQDRMAEMAECAHANRNAAQAVADGSRAIQEQRAQLQNEILSFLHDVRRVDGASGSANAQEAA